jgi:hypothetical protein
VRGEGSADCFATGDRTRAQGTRGAVAAGASFRRTYAAARSRPSRGRAWRRQTAAPSPGTRLRPARTTRRARTTSPLRPAAGATAGRAVATLSRPRTPPRRTPRRGRPAAPRRRQGCARPPCSSRDPARGGRRAAPAARRRQPRGGVSPRGWYCSQGPSPPGGGCGRGPRRAAGPTRTRAGALPTPRATGCCRPGACVPACLRRRGLSLAGPLTRAWPWGLRGTDRPRSVIYCRGANILDLSCHWTSQRRVLQPCNDEAAIGRTVAAATVRHHMDGQQSPAG